MPRVMTMNPQSVATAPLDLSIANRKNTGSRTPDRKVCARDARGTGGSPAPPACTGTGSSEPRSPSGRASPGTETSAACKRPADRSSLKLPFRKRPIPVEPETQSPSPAPPGSGDSSSPVGETKCEFQRRLAGRLDRTADESRAAVAPVTPRHIQESAQSPEGYPWCFLHPLNYGHYPMYCLPVPEPHHPLVHQTGNLLAGISLATHQDEDGDTALHIAVVQGELNIVCKLINLLVLARRGLDIYNNLRQTPLHLAVITKQTNIVEALLRAGADPTALDRHGQTAFHLCCEYVQRDCLSVVLSLSPSSTSLEIRNFEGLSPLHLAVRQGHQDLAKMLLDAGADINAMDIKSGQNPLMHAVENNNTDMVHFLIENGCDVNNQSYSGNTALHIACGRGQEETVRLLLKSGADSSLKNNHNDTPVMVAKNNKIADVLRGRGSKQTRVQDQNSMSVSPHRSYVMQNGSPSSNHSRGSSPSTTPHALHHSASHSPKTPSNLYPFY
ncbi:B-cell lymphoma 3 protein homolog [Leuresthes tenuis]|uniref:B-cell lymphoma 3 protein homolog n=1 Tax=Leuresthes tenuis TaxID=355514 RepID=UPI003B507319